MNTLEPIRDKEATLVDLLDRVLEKGLVLNADIIISLAGIPLIGLKLNAALAGIETMLEYGLMEAEDQKIRQWAKVREEIVKEEQKPIAIASLGKAR